MNNMVVNKTEESTIVEWWLNNNQYWLMEFYEDGTIIMVKRSMDKQSDVREIKIEKLHEIIIKNERWQSFKNLLASVY